VGLQGGARVIGPTRPGGPWGVEPVNAKKKSGATGRTREGTNNKKGGTAKDYKSSRRVCVHLALARVWGKL